MGIQRKEKQKATNDRTNFNDENGPDSTKTSNNVNIDFVINTQNMNN